MLQGTRARLAARHPAPVCLDSSSYGPSSRALADSTFSGTYFRFMRSATERRSGTEWPRALWARPACCVRPAGPANWPRGRPFHGAADARYSAKRWVFSCEVAHFWLVGVCVLRLSDCLNFADFVRWG